MVNFQCERCNTQFSMPNDYFLRRKEVKCPTCDKPFPDDALKSLQECVSAYNQAHKHQEEARSNNNTDVLTFSLSLD